MSTGKKPNGVLLTLDLIDTLAYMATSPDEMSWWKTYRDLVISFCQDYTGRELSSSTIAAQLYASWTLISHQDPSTSNGILVMTKYAEKIAGKNKAFFDEVVGELRRLMGVQE